MTNCTRAGGCAGCNYPFLTLKERDVETGLDYFLARYYSAIQGRFTGIDPANAGASVIHPQSWNGYSYALSNPLRYIDPDGLRWAQIAFDGGIQYMWFDDIEKDDNGQTEYDRALAVGYSAVDFDESKAFSYTNGILAPGEVLTTVTLNTDGRVESSQHTLTWREWSVLLYLARTQDFINYVDGKDSNLRIGLLGQFLDSRFGEPSVQGSVSLPTVPGPAYGPPHPRETARKRGAELVKKFKEAGEGVGRSGGGGEKYKKAGAELIREANKMGNNALRDEMKKEGQRLINYGRSVSHK